MKNMTKLLMLLILVTGFTSCSLFDVDVDTTMSADLEIDIEDSAIKSAAAYAFQSEAVIDPMDNDDVDKYADKIERIKAKEIVATVEYVSKENVVLYKGSKFSVANATWTLEDDWPMEKGTEIELPDGNGIYDEISKVLTSLDPFTVSCEGTASEKGVSITIRIDIDTKVTGNPF